MFDTLRYTALLRMSKTLTKEEKISRVRSVMEQLGLTKCSSTIIVRTTRTCDDGVIGVCVCVCVSIRATPSTVGYLAGS